MSVLKERYKMDITSVNSNVLDNIVKNYNYTTQSQTIKSREFDYSTNILNNEANKKTNSLNFKGINSQDFYRLTMKETDKINGFRF